MRRAKVVDPTDARAARNAALDALARRDHASADLARALRDRGYEAAIAERVVATLVAERLVDDSRYVQNFIAYHAGRGQGPARVRAELRQKGVIGDVVEEGLAAFADWNDAMEAARRKKFGAARPDGYPERMRQARFLSYRGFTSAQIRTVLGSVVDRED